MSLIFYSFQHQGRELESPDTEATCLTECQSKERSELENKNKELKIINQCHLPQLHRNSKKII